MKTEEGYQSDVDDIIIMTFIKHLSVQAHQNPKLWLSDPWLPTVSLTVQCPPNLAEIQDPLKSVHLLPMPT